jgi:lysophospholipase L1-like esterase
MFRSPQGEELGGGRALDTPGDLVSPASRAMGDGSPTSRVGRLIGIAVLGAMAVFAGILVPAWVPAYLPTIAPRDGVAAALRLLRLLYVGLLIATPPAIAAMGIAMAAARRRGSPRARAALARGMAAGLSLALGMAIAEGASAVRLRAMRVHEPRLRERFDDPPQRPLVSSGAPTLRDEFPDAAVDADRTVDIIVVGESSAHGDPYDRWLSVGEIVAWKLREAIPGRRFSFRCLARPGTHLDEMHQRLEELERRPDLAILYAGHNEFSMRHDWSRDVPYYLDRKSRRPPPIPIEGLATVSPVCRLIDETIGRRLRSVAPVRTPGRQLVDVPIYDEAEYAEILRDFRRRLEAMTSYLERMGATVVLVIPPGNDADFEPNRSFLPAATPEDERAAFAAEVRAARELEGSDPDAAASAYRRLIDRQPGFAETHYRLARLEEAAGHREEAARHYVAARDRDGLPVRCMSEFQDAYREVAARHPRAILVDGPAVLRGVSGRPAAGDNCFTDGFHPSLIGYTELAEAILRGLHARRAFGWGAGAPAPPPEVTPAACARRFGMDPTRWVEVCEYAAWFYLHGARVRFEPTDRLAHRARYERAIERLQAGDDPDDLGVPGIGTKIIPTGPVASRREPE